VKIRSILAPGCAVLAATVVAVAGAQQADRNPAWPPITGSPIVTEWYSDLPWNQKLGTYTGNQLDEAIMMPYGALPAADRDFCTSKKLSPADCMIEVGVSNILGMQRVDTRYAPFPTDKVPAECKDSSQPCIEVLLRLSNFYGKSSGGNVTLARRVFGPALPINGDFPGYTVSDGSTYAPQMPWFTAHYCENMFKAFPSKPTVIPDIQDPVCYADYFSPFNNGFNYLPNVPAVWPRAAPWSPWPQSPNNHCKEGSEVCTLAFAGFDLHEVPETFDEKLQYFKYNNFLLQWFNYGLKGFKEDVSVAENQRKFPWSGNPVTWKDFYYYSAMNPFLGTFEAVNTVGPNVPGCDTTLTGPTTEECTTTAQWRASQTLYPRECSLTDLKSGDAKRLRKCGLNYEFHHNGWIQQWPSDWEAAIRAAQMYPSNQYGRTSFLFAGVPGMQLPVSFYKSPDSPSGMSVYEQVYNTSVFSLYLPIANEADQKRAYSDRQYKDKTFYHTLLMTNHMEADPEVFADGIRGKALWHNEYRMQGMYDDWAKNPSASRFQPVTFNASFDESKAPAPFHGSTCDSCHVRNGSGIPINTKRALDAVQHVFMSDKEYKAAPTPADYTFTGKIHPMKLVFFDLRRYDPRGDGSVYSQPLSFTPATLKRPPRDAPQVYYNNAIMNFYGDAFHVTKAPFDYEWSFQKAGDDSLVVKTERRNPELGVTYTPWQVKVGSFKTSSTCEIVKTVPAGKPWPANCDDVSGGAIEGAIEAQQVGYMLLNGKRLGNSSAIEAMPDDAILGFREAQKTTFGEALAGEVIYTVGSRNGIGGVVKKDCYPNDPRSCFIGRFGWLGDRASLEDQVANAAFVEMNMTSSEGYKKLYGENGSTTSPIRYLTANCGPANASCFGKPGNSDLSERDIERMADYARWIGNPTRSEFQVQLPEVMAGEKVFRNLQCDSCHVIKKIPIDPAKTMLSDAYVKRLANRIQGSGPDPIAPFLSYLGTDLLMHDMGYLSQVGHAKSSIRNEDGTVKHEFRAYVQKIRTPALKGMRFNRFVTDSHRNVKNAADPACDFLMHDGRACDAVEAAFMHDGPAVKKIGMIEKLTNLKAEDLRNLRAFLYSL
jgi:CxxC motif-containing protein (DUF1111 family)